MTRALTILSILILFGGAASAQVASSVDPFPARLDLAGGYTFTRANAPPATCGCFDMNGGFASGTFNLGEWFGIEGRFTMGHASNISSLDQNLTLMTFTGGPKVTWRTDHFSPYGDFLIGGARGSGSYFPSASSFKTSATSFAWSTGGGIDVRLSDRLSLRAVDAQFLRTGFPNASTNTQNHLQISAGIVFHFGNSNPVSPSQSTPPPPPAPAEPETQVNFQCSASNPAVNPGDIVTIQSQSFTVPDAQPLNYFWTTSGGTIQGQGKLVTVDTVGLAPGKYLVEGRASLQDNPSISTSCQATFEVNAPEVHPSDASGIPPSPLETSGVRFDDFKAHITDTFFDYDQSTIRPDAQIAVEHDAAYLIAHPDMKITIAGYADERGSAEYNIALGLERAISTRAALAAAGVAMSRMQVLSYGKEKPFCTDDTDSCLQLNRRGQLLLNVQVP
jgi:outer membrane protein OmpA-like peptidoglycan-associated protein